jgi:indolepyruvate ferredoxin oxidoreductase, alpha subunit
VKKYQFLSGNEAVGRGAYEAGLRVACAYPGTPSTEILEYLSQYKAVDSQWSVNEKAAYEVALSAAIGGVRSLYASKHVGINVAMDPLMTSAYTGINAGFVAVVCDDPGLASSQNEQDTRWVGMYGKLPVIEPSSPSEAYTYVREAYTVSEHFDTPVIFRMTTRVAHCKEDVATGERVKIASKKFSINIPKYVMVPLYADARHVALEKRLCDLAQFAERTKLNRIEQGSSKLGFITSGVSYLYVRELFPDASILKLGFSYPFCERKIRAFSRSVKEMIVIEELDPILENYVKTLGINCRSKHPSFRTGELRPEYLKAIYKGESKPLRPLSPRKPVLCPGCPHRFVFTALRTAGAIITGDIGCYTLGSSPPLSSIHTTLCMGASVTFQEGFRRALPRRVIAGVIGDSTFIHSGITGLINAVYNNAKGLIIILDNSTIAMTGCQDHPGTGKTITNAQSPRLVLEDLCRSCGVKNVDVITPYKLRALEKLIRKRLSEDALSVIIAREPCRLIDPRKRPAPSYDRNRCTVCGVCLSIDCPNITREPDGHVTFNTRLCAGCNLCVEVCPAKALKAYGK